MHRKMRNVYYEVRDPRLTWDDIGGYRDIKAILKEMVCLPLVKRSELEKMGVEPPAGVIMWGPLGVGITMLAEACASEAGVTYIYISGQEMLGKPDDMEEAFRLARSEAPCVLYISDVEWLAPRAGVDYRWNGGGERGKPPTLADRDLTRKFVELVDMVQEDPRVALMGACYRIDTVDQAVIKEKTRFNRKVFVHPPTVDDRLDMLELFRGRHPVEEGLDLRAVAGKVEGFVGWDLENLYKKAALNSVSEGRERISQEDLLGAVERIRPWLTAEMIRGYHQIYEEDCPHHYTF